MSEIVSRVAQAMWDRMDLDRGALQVVSLDHLLELAEAAIRAMREPTAEMLERGCEAWPLWEGEPKDFRASWQAMIDEALKDLR